MLNCYLYVRKTDQQVIIKIEVHTFFSLCPRYLTTQIRLGAKNTLPSVRRKRPTLFQYDNLTYNIFDYSQKLDFLFNQFNEALILQGAPYVFAVFEIVLWP